MLRYSIVKIKLRGRRVEALPGQLEETIRGIARTAGRNHQMEMADVAKKKMADDVKKKMANVAKKKMIGAIMAIVGTGMKDVQLRTENVVMVLNWVVMTMAEASP